MDPVGIPNLWKDEEAKVPVLLRSTAGVVQTGIAFSDVTAKYARNGDSALQTQALDASKWTELGEGNYWMTFPSSVPNVAGPFMYQVATTATGNDTFIGYSRVEMRPEDRIWDEDATGHTTAGSMSDRFTDLEAKIDPVDTVADAVKAKTDSLSFTGTDVKATLDGEVVSYQAFATLRYNQTGATACILAWLHADGEIVTAPTSARVIAYDESDNVVFDSTSVAPDAYGFFRITIDPLTLTALKAHKVRVIIVNAGVTYESGEAFVTFN